MKGNGIWMLIAGLALGFVLGREVPKAGGGGEAATAETAAPKAAAQAAGPIPTDWILEDGLGAKDTMTGLTPAQRFAVLKFYNETPCDCGCPHGSFAKCKKEDPGCPRAPKVLEQAVALAKQGKSYTEIAAATKKPAGGDNPGGGAAPPAPYQKAELAAWTPIEGPKYAKVTIVEYSDFQ